MKKIYALVMAAALVVQAGYAMATEADTVTAPTGPSTSAGGTTVVVPEGGNAQVVVPPAPVTVEKSVPRDAITGEAVDTKPKVEKEESLRDQVRDKMKN